jgi:sulfate adenylyltransferase large subunit
MLTATDTAAIADIQEFLRADEQKELLRFTTAGSVDDGKSTLIGRLLYDTKGVYEDQIASVIKSPVNRSSGPIDFSLLTDGLRAEREQGITIDVAYRYFATPKRKFIIADTPGHEQYTRNMATGASTANLAIILIDARNGVLPQSRRHGFIASLLSIPHALVAVNKMDLVDYSRHVFESIRREYAAFARRIGLRDVAFLPISALHGDNVVTRGERMPWFEGPTLLEHLETVPIGEDRNFSSLRFPVQYVLRPDLNFRGYAGQVSSGVLRPGDAVMALPSGRTSRVKEIVTWDGPLEEAFPPLSITVRLEDEIDLGRGDMLVHPYHLPRVGRRFEAMLVWMHPDALRTGQPYLIKHTTQQTRATVTALRHRVDINTLEQVKAASLNLNEIGLADIEVSRPLFFDAYKDNRATGAFILIDPLNNLTVAAGMIVSERRTEPARAPVKEREAETPAAGRVTLAERIARVGHYAAAIWLPARPELAYVLERKLFDRGLLVKVVEEAGAGLEVAVANLYQAGALVICALDVPDDAARQAVRDSIGADRLVDPEMASLSLDDEKAAQQILDQLEQRKLIRPYDRFTRGEGI